MRIDSRLPGLTLTSAPGTLTVTTRDGTRSIPSDQIGQLTLRDVAVWPWWWFGWGPGHWRTLEIVGRDGRVLEAVPAGGGWVEDSRRTQRYMFLPVGETAPRLRPIWSHTAVHQFAAAAGWPLVQVHGSRTRPRPVIVTSLNDPWTVEPDCVRRRWAAAAIAAVALLGLILGVLAS